MFNMLHIFDKTYAFVYEIAYYVFYDQMISFAHQRVSLFVIINTSVFN